MRSARYLSYEYRDRTCPKRTSQSASFEGLQPLHRADFVCHPVFCVSRTTCRSAAVKSLSHDVARSSATLIYFRHVESLHARKNKTVKHTPNGYRGAVRVLRLALVVLVCCVATFPAQTSKQPLTLDWVFGPEGRAVASVPSTTW